MNSAAPTAMSNPLANYRIVYEVTVAPHIIFCEMTPADQYFTFPTLEIPPELRQQPIDCRFLLFDQEGQLIEMEMQTAGEQTLCYTLNITPLKMIQRLVARLRG